MTKLQISPEAKKDMTEIKKYISQELDSPHAAEKLLAKMTGKIRRLLDYPLMGAPLFSIIDIETDYRFLVCDSYLIFYRYDDEVIYVVRVLFGRRDYMHILFKDFSGD